MRIVLVYTPMSDPTQPYASLPILQGFLRANRYQDVLLRDLNIAMYHDFFSSGLFPQLRSKVQARLESLGEGDELDDLHTDEFKALMGALESSIDLEERYRQALSAMRDNRFYDSGQLKDHLNTIGDVFRLVSAAFHPLSVSFNSYAIPFRSAQDIEDYLVDGQRNVLFDWFKNSTLKDLRCAQPDVVGISVTYQSQMIPSLTLAGLIKREFPRTLVVGGGDFLTACFQTSKDEFRDLLLRSFHAIVLFDGERALLDLLHRYVEIGRIPAKLPQVWRRQSDKGVPEGMEERAEPFSQPPACFDGLPLHMYLTPTPVLPVVANRGCYHGRCAFCAVSRSADKIFRRRPASSVVEEMEMLVRQHHCQHFWLCADAMPPADLSRIADLIIEKSLHINWVCEVRFEPAFKDDLLRKLRQAGCRLLIFGLESASQRVLDLMNKGTRLTHIEKVLQGCHRADIPVNLQCMVGFPGETPSEARETVQFLIRRREQIYNVALGQFDLMPSSDVHCRPQKYGVQLKGEYPDWNGYDYDVSCGMSREEASKIYVTLFAELFATFPNTFFFGFPNNAQELLYLSRYPAGSLKNCLRESTSRR